MCFKREMLGEKKEAEKTPTLRGEHAAGERETKAFKSHSKTDNFTIISKIFPIFLKELY